MTDSFGAKFLVIVRHADYDLGTNFGDQPLSALGIEQIQKLRRVICTALQRIGGKRSEAVLVSFSDLNWAIQSARKLSRPGDILIVFNGGEEGEGNRRHIREPRKILEKLMGFANHCEASVIIAVAHGDMPSVIAETAHEFVTQKRLNLPSVDKARGFVVDITTGEVTSIGWDNPLDETTSPQTAVRESSRPVFKGGPNDMRGDEIFF